MWLMSRKCSFWFWRAPLSPRLKLSTSCPDDWFLSMNRHRMEITAGGNLWLEATQLILHLKNQ